MNEAKIKECYNKWLNKEPGYTRSTMSRSAYNKQMKASSEAQLKRNNFTISIKQHQDEQSYRKAKAR